MAHINGTCKFGILADKRALIPFSSCPAFNVIRVEFNPMVIHTTFDAWARSLYMEFSLANLMNI